MSRWRFTFVLAVVSVMFCLAGCGSGGTSRSQDALAETTAPRPSESSEAGEKSIEDFGMETVGGSRAALLGAFRGYLRSIGAKDYAKACTYLTASVQRSLEQLVGGKLRRCEAILSKLVAPSAPAIAREQAEGTVSRVRAKGDRAFVIYHAPGAKLYQLSMSREGGAWKASIAIGAVLVP